MKFNNICIILIVLINYSQARTVTNSYYLDCSIDYGIMRLIAKIERSPKREIGYPYIIAINRKNISLILEKLGINKRYYLELDSRSIDCLSMNHCSNILFKLKSNGYNNFDLGAFQLNSKWQHLEDEDYFNLDKSYMKACIYVESLIDKYGYSWETISKYHSFTKKYRDNYLKNMERIHLKEINRNEKDI